MEQSKELFVSSKKWYGMEIFIFKIRHNFSYEAAFNFSGQFVAKIYTIHCCRHAQITIKAVLKFNICILLVRCIWIKMIFVKISIRVKLLFVYSRVNWIQFLFHSFLISKIRDSWYGAVHVLFIFQIFFQLAVIYSHIDYCSFHHAVFISVQINSSNSVGIFFPLLTQRRQRTIRTFVRFFVINENFSNVHSIVRKMKFERTNKHIRNLEFWEIFERLKSIFSQKKNFIAKNLRIFFKISKQS